MHPLRFPAPYAPYAPYALYAPSPMALMRSGAPSMRRAERSAGARSMAAAAGPVPAKKKIDSKAAWREFRELLWVHRRRLTIGLTLMMFSRMAGIVLPALSKYVIDDVIGKGRVELLMPIALAAGAATVVQAFTSFGLSQILGVAAQRAITDMRKRVQAKIMRLPVRYFDSTQSGVLLSRIMSDAEGIRNLVGTGLVQLVGGVLTAIISLGVLLYLNWRMTVVTAIVLGLFGGGMAYAFKRLRPLFRERGKIQAEVTGRLTEALGGIRIVKSYTAEKREEIVFTHGAHKLFRNIAQSMTGVSATTSGSTVIIGVVGVIMIWMGGNDILAGTDDARRLRDVHLLHRPARGADDFDCQHRHADHRGVRRARSHPRDPQHGDRGRGRRGQAVARRRFAAKSPSRRCGSNTTRAFRSSRTSASSPRPAPPRRWSARAARARAR